MVTALILLALALVICLAFMGITTYMYIKLEKDFQRQRAVVSRYASTVKENLEKIDAQVELAHNLNTLTEGLYSDAKKTAEDAKRSTEFAMQTAQEARKTVLEARKTLQETGNLPKSPAAPSSQIVYKDGKPKP